MKIAYFDCASGISGDMTLAALVDTGVDLDLIQNGIDSLGLPDCRISQEEVKRKGFRARQIHINHPPEHAHRHLHHIVKMIDGSNLSAAQQETARQIFTRLAEAEAKVHGTTVEKVHFHEVGAVDSIADIVGSAIGLDLLGVEQIVFSPIPTGTGHIVIAHGRVSVPAPATAELLKGCPLAESNVPCELTTPTGAAIAVSVADQFGPLPAMNILQIGYGAGSRDLAEQANILRLFIGETLGRLESDEVAVIETNIDDMPGEVIGHCTAQLAAAGALDVYTTPIQMKKNRPGVKITVLCPAELVTTAEKILFRETSTLGVRRWTASRRKLPREPHAVGTKWGQIAGKVATMPDGSRAFSPEFEACRAVAEQHQIALNEVYEAARSAYRKTEP
jgi:uncharacterized protein (TIGR00299 family) protein